MGSARGWRMALAAALVLAWRPAGARCRTCDPSLAVRPSPRIEARVDYEVAKARRILEELDAHNVLKSRYLIAAVYYHDGWLDGFPVHSHSADPERRIVGQICQMLTPERKARFVAVLRDVWDRADPPGPERWVDPLLSDAMGGGRRSHQDAIDLFTAEGSPVYSASRGIVVLADRGWNARNPFSTSSRKGGNAVIVFDPDDSRFYRYAHLRSVLARPGELVAAGQVIGRVGHTGMNASRPGHGRHLHFEINQYAGGRTRVIQQAGLRRILLDWPAPRWGGSTGEAARSSEP